MGKLRGDAGKQAKAAGREGLSLPESPCENTCRAEEGRAYCYQEPRGWGNFLGRAEVYSGHFSEVCKYLLAWVLGASFAVGSRCPACHAFPPSAVCPCNAEALS